MPTEDEAIRKAAMPSCIAACQEEMTMLHWGVEDVSCVRTLNDVNAFSTLKAFKELAGTTSWLPGATDRMTGGPV